MQLPFEARDATGITQPRDGDRCVWTGNWQCIFMAWVAVVKTHVRPTGSGFSAAG